MVQCLLKIRGTLDFFFTIRVAKGQGHFPSGATPKQRGKMNITTRNIILAAAGILAILLAGPNDLQARDVTIVGEINEHNELVSSEDGTIYQIAEGKIGEQLISKHRGEKVRIFGKLVKEVTEYSIDELPKGVIHVSAFEDVPE